MRDPWRIKSLELDETGMQLLVHVDFARCSRFAVVGNPDKLLVHGTSVR